MCFAWVSMVVQVACSVISGIGPYIARGTGAATAQVLSVALVKLGWACILLTYRPCVCLLVNLVISMQVCQHDGSQQ